jgi:fumarate reductase flavoprotein subunit
MNQMPAETDAVVIGSGASGLTAAVTLAEGGARVIVYEKERALGGSSNFLRGIFAVESELQRQRYITYSRDQDFKKIMEFSHWRANPRLVRAIVNESATTISWLLKQGVEFREAAMNMPETPQTYHVVRGTGEAMIKALATRAKELGVSIVLATPVKQILKTGNRIAGVIIEEGEEDIQIAAKAVIVATGGYANNKEWIKKYAGFDLDIDVTPVGNVHKIGDGIRMAFQVGAADEGLGILELLRTGLADLESAGYLGFTVVQPDLWINSQGERFCDESITFYDTDMGNASARQNGCTYSIFDSAILKYLMEKGMDKAMTPELPPGTRLPELEQEIESAIGRNNPTVFKADSIKSLAEKTGIDPMVLQATVDEYNDFCDKGHDALFAKNPKYLRPIRVPPFFAVKAHTVFLGTLGGIKINHKTEVIDKQGNIIPGLYAGGYDAGGMYGDSYCIRNSTGLSSGFAVNSGRLAGKNALSYIGK